MSNDVGQPEASVTQKAIPPNMHFPFEHALLILGFICMMLCFPVLVLALFVHTQQVTMLIPIFMGVGILLLALSTAVAEFHFGRIAVPSLATVTREYRLVENYFPRQSNTPQYKGVPAQAQRLPTVVVQFIAMSGEHLTLELMANTPKAHRGDQLPLLYLATKPTVAKLASFSYYPLVIFYTLIGLGLIATGLFLLR